MVAERAEGKNSQILSSILATAGSLLHLGSYPASFPVARRISPSLLCVRPGKLAIGIESLFKLLLHSSHFAAIRAALLFPDRSCTLLWLCLADKLLVCLIFITTAFGFRYLARCLGPSGDLMSLFIIPLLLNWPLGMGFYNYCLAIGMALWALGFWYRAVQQRSHRLWLAYPDHCHPDRDHPSCSIGVDLCAGRGRCSLAIVPGLLTEGSRGRKFQGELAGLSLLTWSTCCYRGRPLDMSFFLSTSIRWWPMYSRNTIAKRN